MNASQQFLIENFHRITPLLPVILLGALYFSYRKMKTASLMRGVLWFPVYIINFSVSAVLISLLMWVLVS